MGMFRSKHRIWQAAMVAGVGVLAYVALSGPDQVDPIRLEEMLRECSKATKPSTEERAECMREKVKVELDPSLMTMPPGRTQVVRDRCAAQFPNDSALQQDCVSQAVLSDVEARQ